MILETNLGIHSAKQAAIERKTSWTEGMYSLASSSAPGVVYMRRRSKKQRLKRTGIIDRPEDLESFIRSGGRSI
jgi:hypothetical protein